MESLCMLRLLAQPMLGLMSAARGAATALPGLSTKNPQELVRGLSREIGILVSPLDDDGDWLVFLDFLFGYHWYWTRQIYVSPNC